MFLDTLGGGDKKNSGNPHSIDFINLSDDKCNLGHMVSRDEVKPILGNLIL